MPGKEEAKLCFVIGPIGDEHTPVRTNADWLLKGIVKPTLAAPPFDYSVRRADEFTEPGLITDQVIAATLDAALVVADLTGWNPNAFYELAIRHMVGKPVIHMIRTGEKPPFDVKDYRAITYSIDHPNDVEQARRALAAQARTIETADYQPLNAITRLRRLPKPPDSADPAEKLIASLSARIERLDSRLSLMDWTINQIVAEISRAGRACQ
jgi:hypothetical protein